MSMYCPECLHPHGRHEACGPAFTSECVICDACIGPEDSGLCDAHKYDEQVCHCGRLVGFAACSGPCEAVSGPPSSQERDGSGSWREQEATIQEAAREAWLADDWVRTLRPEERLLGVLALARAVDSAIFALRAASASPGEES